MSNRRYHIKIDYQWRIRKKKIQIIISLFIEKQFLNENVQTWKMKVLNY